MDPWVRPLTEALAAGRTVEVEHLVTALARAGSAADWTARARFAPHEPYGRQVVLAQGAVEVMLAGWSRAHPCAPHDHGSGLGAVRVLQGQAQHRAFSARDGRLVPGPAERLEAGAFVRCPRGLVHQMEDAGGPRPLVTLHLYAYVGGGAPMVVYDLPRGRTQWLAPDCGAWVRAYDDPAVLGWAHGLVRAPVPPAGGSAGGSGQAGQDPAGQ
ncbi:MAG: cysteine dioxygenase family protein [Myxococcales bacterium]|nr:cysteine dioxygenase family protein [Myxococcales bacterium]